MRKGKFRHIRIDEDICTLLQSKAESEAFVGDFGHYVETVLKRFGRGLLADPRHINDEVRRVVQEEIEHRISDFQVEPVVGAAQKRRASNE